MPWKRVFYNAKARCENPKNSRYKYYGLRGIKFLITKEQIKFLWYRDKAYLMDKPSIDRMDNKGNYTLENCQFIEHSKNSRKDNVKPVLQYDLDGKFIREWGNIGEASKSLKINRTNIGQCAKGNKYKTVGGFKWKFQKF